MLRVTALFALLALLGGSCSAASNKNYRPKLDAVQATSYKLDSVLVERKYSVLEPELHYLVLVGLANTAAIHWLLNRRVEAIDPKNYLKDALQKTLPLILRNPNKTVADVKKLNSDTLDQLASLDKLVYELCDEVPADNECDRLVNAVVDNDQQLQREAKLLDIASNVASGVLAKDARLEEVTRSLDVVPYLLDNLGDATLFVEDLKNLYAALYNVKPV